MCQYWSDIGQVQWHNKDYTIDIQDLDGQYDTFIRNDPQKDKTMVDIFMYISNDDTQISPFIRLQLVVEMIEHSTELK